MKMTIKAYKKADRRPEEMWEPDGCMTKAVEGSGVKRLTQRTFDKVQHPDDVAVCLNQLREEKQKQNAKGAIENSTCDKATDAPVTAHYSSYQNHTGESAPSTSHRTMDHCSSGSHNTDHDIPPTINYVASDATPHDFPAEPCLVEKKSIPPQINTEELRTYFAERIESTQQLTPPDLDSSPSPIRPVIRSTSLPANSRSSQSISIESQRFFENLRREEERLEIGREVTVKKEVQLLGIEQGLRSRRQELKEREDMASNLRGQVSDPETTETVLTEIEAWINDCPEGVGIMKERINEMKSDAASRKKSMGEESKCLHEKLRTVEAECDDIRKEVKQLEDQIASHEKELKAMLETEQHLALIKQSCAEFAKSR
ncbi:hypothetical protein FBULB1_8298 [Fusarium bulbicola]|nr:hypothetical protein FBULB1_8298 [Fusarium bulbicola]